MNFKILVLILFELIQKENVDNLLRLRFLRYLQTPMHHIRAKAHALRREHQLPLLVLLSICRFSESKNKKLTPLSICPCMLSQPIGISAFKGFDIFVYFTRKDKDYFL